MKHQMKGRDFIMDLSTKYLGLTLRSPLVASAGPLTGSLAGITRLAESGVGAIVLPSLFEEQLRAESDRDLRLARTQAESHGEAQSYFPDLEGVGAAADWPHRYLDLIWRAAAEVDIPVIASLNGVSAGGWTDCASAMEASAPSRPQCNRPRCRRPRFRIWSVSRPVSGRPLGPLQRRATGRQ